MNEKVDSYVADRLEEVAQSLRSDACDDVIVTSLTMSLNGEEIEVGYNTSNGTGKVTLHD